MRIALRRGARLHVVRGSHVEPADEASRAILRTCLLEAASQLGYPSPEALEASPPAERRGRITRAAQEPE